MVHTLLAACATAGAVIIGHFYSRLNAIEDELKKAQHYNRKMWTWAREHIELYYKYRQEGAPDPKPIPEEK